MNTIHFDERVIALMGFAILLTGGITQIGKYVIEQKLDPVANQKSHDFAVFMFNLVAGALVVFALSWVYVPGFLNPVSVTTAILIGVGVGLAASGNYKWLTMFKGFTGGTPTPDPSPIPAPAPAPIPPPAPVAPTPAPVDPAPAVTSARRPKE